MNQRSQKYHGKLMNQRSQRYHVELMSHINKKITLVK